MKNNIKTQLETFQTQPLRPAALALLNTLGYHSPKTLELDGSPATFLERFNQNPEATRFNEEKAQVGDWTEVPLFSHLINHFKLLFYKFN